MTTTQIKNQHLMWRAGFGITTEAIDEMATIQPAALYEILDKKSAAKPKYIDVAGNVVSGLLMGVKDIVTLEQKAKELSADQKKQIRKQSRENLKNLNTAWLDEMVNSEAQLREKMSLFWHGHFACRIINIYYQQLLLDAIRTNALENFGDLLMAVSKSAAMLNFLNNQQNKKRHPNENFAREVMELFTLGRGNYTEQDVKEAARAFTGWGFQLNGDFVFRQLLHDDGSKTFLGKTGNFTGEDIINILLEQKQTATFITKKIYRFFVNDTADATQVNWLAERFYDSGYNIRGLMKDIFTSAWFYDEKNIGSHIKSPVELLVGIRRTLSVEINNEAVQLLLQRALGQLLFYPPNVAGWPGGKTWIDSSTIMLRLRIPQLFAEDEMMNIALKPDDDQQMGMDENMNVPAKKGNDGPGKKNRLTINATIDWSKYAQEFSSVPRNNLYDVLETVLLQTAPNSLNAALNAAINTSSREAYIKSTTIALMSTPEYQLC